MPLEKRRDLAELEPPGRPSTPAAGLRAAFELVDLCYHLRPWPVSGGVRRSALPS